METAKRIIKFRVWRKDTKEWERHGLGMGTDGVLMSNHNEDYELNQFTGLTDKNGKEIYEGDVVEIVGGREYAERNPSWNYQYRAAVQWTEGGCGFDLDRSISTTRFGGHDLAFLANQLEAIGNIYDNPELLA